MTYSFDTTRVIRWFNAEKRELPWRNSPTPYHVWISEVMLQQTQVAVVIPYFENWMKLFPSIEDLALAPLDKVIKAWEGLGYYSRARNLHAGARYIVDHYQGTLPSAYDLLAKIKGLGPYTIGAIRSFAFHEKAAAVDGNVIRVLARYLNIADDISKPKTINLLRKIAEDILPEKEHWIFNEALIELGATICSRNPKCSECPVKGSCRAYAHGTTQKLPYKSKRIKAESLYRAVAIIKSKDQFLIRRCDKGKIMSDLHEFPYFETSKMGINDKELEAEIFNNLKLNAKMKIKLSKVNQSFTRYRVQLYPSVLVCKNKQPVQGYEWKSLEEIQKLALSSGHKRILTLLVGSPS